MNKWYSGCYCDRNIYADSFILKSTTMKSQCSSNSEAFASELLEHRKIMKYVFFQYHLHIDVFSRLKSSTTQQFIARHKRVKIVIVGVRSPRT